MSSLLSRSRAGRPPLDRIEAISFEDDRIVARFVDGRVVECPIEISPRLMQVTPRERSRWRLIGAGPGVHWPDLDEDISVDAILKAKPSMEGEESSRRWLARRAVRQASI